MVQSSMSADEVVRRLLPAIASGNVRAVVGLCSPDVVFEFPFAPSDRPGRIVGRTAVLEYLLGLAAQARPREVRDLRVHRTEDPHVVIAEWTLVDASARQSFVVVLTVQNDLIERYRDYWGPRRSGGESVAA